jgi:hypothetical protein
MPQPKTKAKILKRLETERRRLEHNLAGLSADAMLQPGVVGQWSVKDILAHLADWEARMPVWTVETPEPGLTWKQLSIVNRRIYEAHRDWPLEEVLDYFRSTHRRFMAMVEAMPEDEMLAPGRYAFTGKGAVYDWLSGFAAHDLWGKTKIRAWMKAQG